MTAESVFHIWRFTLGSVFLSMFFLHFGVPVCSLRCAHYNGTQRNVTVVSCEKDEVCFALWRNISGHVTVSKRGCFGSDGKRMESESVCEGVAASGNLTFCKCVMDLCNMNITFSGRKRNTTPTSTKDQDKNDKEKLNLLVILVPVVCVCVLIAFLVFMYCKARSHSKSLLDDSSKMTEAENLLPVKELPPIELLDYLSQGQFCSVRKGVMGSVNVAVKIFPVTQRAKATPSALTEKDIYITCNLNHENILKFIAAQSHDEGSQTQLWLITEYIEKGSLSDFLKQNTITWDNLCHMAEGMALGMAYLHAEIPKQKPSIAHRDMKSKNVLVKNNLTCCISDFGLSLKFDSKNGPGDTHGQVGTRRYMAPEVLEGAINFSREAFLRIDMYAFGLCLWELLSRCTAVEGPVGEYKFPFEEEVGMHPNLEELQDIIVHKKVRPKFCDDWKNHMGIAGIIVTIEECWDHDADARLTADCVAERLKQLRATVNMINERQTSAPLSVSVNINSGMGNEVTT